MLLQVVASLMCWKQS